MVEHSSKAKRKKKHLEDSSFSLPLSSPSSSSPEPSSKRHKSSQRRQDGRCRSSEKSLRRDKVKRRERKKREKRSKRLQRKDKKKISDSESVDELEFTSDGDLQADPADVVRYILHEFPGVSGDLERLLRMIDHGQAVDISGLSDRLLVKHLRKLFLALKLKERRDLVFLLPSDVSPTLEVVGDIIQPETELPKQHFDDCVPPDDANAVEPKEMQVNADINGPHLQQDYTPRRRMIGPEMPSAELLAAAAKLTEAEAELREAEVDEATELFIGPPPPALVAEAESANEAERFEEVTRVMGAEIDNPYDILGVNRNMSADNIKKRYWKLSLLVHPDKCSHPQAQEAFVKMNKAFKDLQDPDKRKAMEELIDRKEEQEKFKLELKALREAAQWRRLQGISMEGDDVLLADTDLKVELRRDEWMTSLPPERKPGMPVQSTSFSRSSREGRGDTSVWTDTPSDRAQKAKMNYLEAYHKTATLAAVNDQEMRRVSADAELVDKYNKAKRSKSLVEKHQEAARSKNSKRKKSLEEEGRKKGDWEGQHPWKPWDREKDLTAGRQSVKLDAQSMSLGLSSRFSSGNFQRKFL